MQRSIKFSIFFTFVISTAFSATALAQGAAGATASSARSVVIEAKPNAAVWIDGVNFGTAGDDGRLTVRLPATGTRELRIVSEGSKIVSQPLGPNEKSVKVAFAPTADTAELAYQAGLRLSLIDRDAAIAKFKEAITAKPGYIDAHVALARTYSDARRLEDADNAIKALRKIKPGIAEASVIEGRILKDFGEEEGAVAAFTRAIKEAGGYQPEAYTGLGLLYQERAETYAGESDIVMEEASYEEAAKHFAVAAKQLLTAPDAPVVYQLLGLIYEKQHKYTEAIGIYEDFIALFPDSPEASAVRSFIVQIKKQQQRDQ